MSKEIIISTEKNQTRIAIVENGELIELHIEDAENERTLGDIYLGRIRRTMPSIQAAFVDIGQKQDAFLHYSDLADNLPQWLALLEQESPRVGAMADSSGAPNQPAKRRPPSRSKRRQSLSRGEKGPKQEVVEAETAEGGREKGEPGKRAGGADQRNNKQNDSQNNHGDKKQQSRPPGKARRRPPQRRRGSRNKSSSDEQQQHDDKHSNGASRNARNGKDTGGRRRGGSSSSNSRPEKFLDKGKSILVKIVKEPISAKGSRVSTDISLAGRFLVLVPLANYVAVSKKIYSYKERRRLRALARSLLPQGFGVIVRTVAEGKKAKELDTDLRLLLDKWRKIEKKLEATPKPPVLVHEDVNMASSVIRDLFSDDYDRILIDDIKLYRNVKNYVQAVAPHMVPAVQQYKGKRHVFKDANIAGEINQAFESRVDLPSGGYLFIEHTEAMHVVDVNSGRAGRGLSQEENSLKVDLEAVHAIAKQVRLRDLGGIIVIDFIDLRDERNRKKIFYELRKAFRKDRAVTKILPMSDFGLVEITRQRLRPSITKTFSGPEEPPPSTAPEDAPKNAPPVPEKPQKPRERPPRPVSIDVFLERIERWISSYKQKSKGRIVHLRVHPFAAAFFNQKIPSYSVRWFMKYFIRVRFIVDDRLEPMEFRFVDPSTGKDLSRTRPPRKKSNKK